MQKYRAYLLLAVVLVAVELCVISHFDLRAQRSADESWRAFSSPFDQAVNIPLQPAAEGSNQLTRNTAILNCAIDNLLHHPDLEQTRTFYGEPRVKNVRFVVASFPSGYWPSAVNVAFEPYVSSQRPFAPDGPKRLTIALKDFYVDEPTTNLLNLVHTKAKGLTLCVFNTGGGNTIGGCTVYYAAGPTTVRYAGYCDP